MKNGFVRSISDGTRTFLALWTGGVEMERASAVIWALEGSGGSPLPPSEVLAMVGVKIVSVLESSRRNRVETRKMSVGTRESA